jgi:hypothetical protein
MKKPDFEDFDSILNNFDAFCDEFESRAAEAFLRGDQNDGRVTKATAEIGTSTPNAVREITDLDQRISQLERPTLMYRRPESKNYESLSDTLDYLHNNVAGIKKDLIRVAQTV